MAVHVRILCRTDTRPGLPPESRPGAQPTSRDGLATGTKCETARRPRLVLSDSGLYRRRTPNAPPMTTQHAHDPVRIGTHVKRHLPRYALGAALLAGYQFAQWWFDTRLMIAINAAVAGDRSTAVQYGLLLGAVAVLAFGVRVLSRLAVFNAGRIAEYELRRVLLARLHRLGPGFFGRMSAGEIMSRATNDLTQIRLLLGFFVLNLMNTAFGLVSALSVTLGISGRLTLASLATLPLLMVATARFARLSYSRTHDAQAALGTMSETVQSSIVGVRVVKTHSMEPQELARFETVNQGYLDKSLALARLRGSMGPIMQGINSVSLVVVVWYGGHLLLQNQITPGGLLAFIRALARLTWPLMALGFLVGILQRGRAAHARLAELYRAEPDIHDGPEQPTTPALGKVEVRDLTYSHGSHQVLKGLSFTLQPGHSLAIVGRTGSGKSTLAELLARILAAPKGTIFLDDKDVSTLPVGHVRRTIGYARQSAFLFSTTAARNVGYSLDDPDEPAQMGRIERAARSAQVLDELIDLPDGLQTVVGERGVQLSGGQKQRVALARAFVYEPRVLLLDDPLSAVDARTESAILDALDEERQARSVILITHRVAAAARCDQIIVLEGGRIVESGTHERLLEARGLYHHLADEERRRTAMAELSLEPLALARGTS